MNPEELAQLQQQQNSPVQGQIPQQAMPPQGQVPPQGGQSMGQQPDPLDILPEVVMAYMQTAMTIAEDMSLDLPVRAKSLLEMSQAIQFLTPLLPSSHMMVAQAKATEKQPSPLDLQFKQAELQMQAQKHQMDLEHQAQAHQLDMQMKSHDLQMRQAENQQKLQIQEAQGQQKIIQSAQQHEMKLQQAKQASHVKQSSNTGSNNSK